MLPRRHNRDRDHCRNPFGPPPQDAVNLLRPPVDPVDAAALREEPRALKAKLTQLGTDFATAPPEFTQAALADIQTRLGEIDALLTDPGKARIFEGVIGAKDVHKSLRSLTTGSALRYNSQSSSLTRCPSPMSLRQRTSSAPGIPR